MSALSHEPLGKCGDGGHDVLDGHVQRGRVLVDVFLDPNDENTMTSPRPYMPALIRWMLGTGLMPQGRT